MWSGCCEITFLPGGEYISAGIQLSALLCSTGFIKAESKVTIVLVVQPSSTQARLPAHLYPQACFVVVLVLPFRMYS